MIVTCKLQGGLGNQLFQLATAYAVAKENNCELNFCNKIWCNNRESYFDSAFDHITHTLTEEQIQSFENQTYARELNEPVKSITKDTCLAGYFQHTKYFDKYKMDIVKWLFPGSKLNHKALSTVVRMRQDSMKTVGIQVRRGDYVALGHALPVSYFRKVILNNSFIDDKTIFLVTTDDIEWCKTNLNFLPREKSLILQEDNITQMLALSLCEYLIISNSTFSWWAAYMNSGANKIFYPEGWAIDIPNDSKWIQVSRQDEIQSNLIAHMIKHDCPCTYVKFGDGEYIAMNYQDGQSNQMNCDNTTYTTNLKDSLHSVASYLLSKPDVFVGKWHHEDVTNYLQTKVMHPINWCSYHLLLFHDSSDFDDQHRDIWRAVKYSSRKKLYICNPFNIEKSKTLLKINHHVMIHPTNWFETSYMDVLQECYQFAQHDEKVMILVSAGMGAKVLIAHLHQYFKDAIILDVGSALDYVLREKPSRHHQFQNYKLEMLQYFFAAL